ncbi:MAG: hypothetical protein SOW08_05655 [Lachnospiraceae bacterium]|nr:hypothetical protein [Lachnospiraceae bacterium]
MKLFEKMTTASLKNQIRAAVSITGNRQRLELTYYVLKASKTDNKFLAMLKMFELTDQRKIDFTFGFLKGLDKKS